MAVDAVRVLHELRAQLAGVRRRMVPDRVHARRPVARQRRQRVLDAVRDQRADVRRQLLVQRGDATHHRLRLPHGHRTVSRGHSVLLFSEHRRADDTGVHGGHRVRENGPAQTTQPDADVQQERRDMSPGRAAVFHVPRGRHATEVPSDRGHDQDAVHPVAGDAGGRDVVAARHQPESVRGRLRRTGVPDVADRGRAPDRPGQPAVRAGRGGPVEREVRGGRRAGGHRRVDGADHAGAHVVRGVRGAVGPPVPSAGPVLQDENGVRGGLLAVPRRVQGGHAAVQRGTPGNVPDGRLTVTNP